MKTYGVFPVIRLIENDERSRRCVELVSKLTFDALTQGGDAFHYALDWLDPGAPEDMGGFNGLVAQPHVRELGSSADLLDRVRRSVDPSFGTWATIRSIATCRMATFGYDGQAFLCLRHEDVAPVTPDPTLVVVEERPDLLTESDYFDGWVPGAEAPANDR